MRFRLRSLLAGLAAMILLPAVAEAAPGYTSADVNLRNGPGIGYRVLVTIPAGALVDVYSCDSWCGVNWRGYEGWVAGGYIEYAAPRYRPPVYNPPPRYVPPPRYYPPRRPAYRDPYCGPRSYMNGRYCQSGQQ